MKHKRLAAAVLAAALWLTGCGGAAAPAAPAGSGAASQSAADTAVQTAQKDRITEQFTLEKTVRDEYGITQKLTIHVPQLVCDSPDAESINDELAARYAAEYRDYESYPQAEVSQDEWCPQIYIDWDAYWYGDCVSLVVSSYYGGTDPIYSQGWCFDFAAGHMLSVTELLMRMGLDPDETQLAVYRAAIQTFDRNMVQQEYYDSLRESGMLSGMRADTLRDNGLENLTVLLKSENTVTLVAGYHTTAGSGWRPLEVEFPLTPAAPAKTPVLTDTYGSVSVLLDGDTRTVTIKHTPEIIAWAEDYDIRLDGDVTLPIRNAYNNYVEVCIGELGASFHPVVYLLTEDGFVEYVDVLRCLLYGQSLFCADPIYIANNGTALALRDAEVSLLCADGEAFLTAAERVLPQYQAQLLIFQSVLAELESVGQKTPAQRQNCQRVLARLQSLERAGVVRVCIGRSAGFSDPNFISDFVQDMLTSNVLLISQDNGLGTTAARLRDFLRPCIQTEYQIFSCRLNRGALEEVQDSGAAAQAPQKSPQPRRAPIPAAAPPDLKWPRRESGFSCTPYSKCNDVHFYPN